MYSNPASTCIKFVFENEGTCKPFDLIIILNLCVTCMDYSKVSHEATWQSGFLHSNGAIIGLCYDAKKVRYPSNGVAKAQALGPGYNPTGLRGRCPLLPICSCQPQLTTSFAENQANQPSKQRYASNAPGNHAAVHTAHVLS